MDSLSKIVDRFYTLVKKSADDLTIHKVYKAMIESHDKSLVDILAYYNPDLDWPDIPAVSRDLAPGLMIKAFNSYNKNKDKSNIHIWQEIWPFLEHNDQMYLIDNLPDEAIFNMLETVPYSHNNYSDVLLNFYRQAFHYYLDEATKAQKKREL